MKTYDVEGYKGLTHLQLVQMRVRTVMERKKELILFPSLSSREESIADFVGWDVFDKAFFMALEMVKSGTIKVETGQ